MTPWMVVTWVSKSSTSCEIDTFITAWSRTMRNCAAASTASVFQAPFAMGPDSADPRQAPQGCSGASAGGARTIDRAAARRNPAPMATTASSRVLPGLAREVAGIMARHRAAALAPAALLGAGADALVLVQHHLGAEIAISIVLAIAFELYVGYAELVFAADRLGLRPRVTALLADAAGRVPALLVASVAAVTLPLAASGLLVLPGLWLLTRWSLD